MEIQWLLILIAFVSVPTMLFVKPMLLRRDHNRGYKPLPDSADGFEGKKSPKKTTIAAAHLPVYQQSMILGKKKRNSILGKYSFIRSSTLLNSCWVLSPTRHLTFVSGRFLWPTPNWPRYDILPSPLICLNQPFASPITGLLGASLCARLGIKYQVFFHHRLCGFRRLGRRHVWRVADHGIPLGLPSCPPSPLVMSPRPPLC